jgi:hypothetical protein
VPFEIVSKRHQEARRAVAALQSKIAVEGDLQRRERSVRCRQAFNGIDAFAVGLHRQHQARANRLAVHSDRACTAYSVLAADMRSGRTDLVANKIGQQHTRLGKAFHRLAIQCEAYAMALTLFHDAHWRASSITFLPSRLTISRR